MNEKYCQPLPENAIFYFSGTGNSLALAREISVGIPRSAVVPLSPLAGGFEVPVHCRRVGIVFPVYMWGIPMVVKRFAENLSFAGRPYVFAAVSCGGMPGATLPMLDAILSSGGHDLSSGFSVTMPGNYIPFYGAWSEKAQAASFREASVRAGKIARIAREGIILPLEKGGFAGNLILSGIVYRLCSPRIPNMDKSFILREQCISCGVCARVCPVGNIDTAVGRPVWKGKCEHCLACLQWCPREAIDFTFVTRGRKRYHHPMITVSELSSQYSNAPQYL